MSRFRYHYYRVEIPTDGDWSPEERANVAFWAANAAARLWIRPCEWTILADDGEIVRVRRKSRVGNRLIVPVV